MAKKFFIGKSCINGVGVFSSKKIKRGEIVFVAKGEIVKFCANTKKKAMSNPNMIGIGKDLWLDPISPAVHINHSCDPNLGTRGRFLFVALRDIDQEEELTFDYSISEDSLWEMECHCNSENCRGVIRGIRFLPKSFYDRYLPNIPHYFQEIYKESHKDI